MFVLVVCVGLAGFLIWLTIEVISTDKLATAIAVLALSYIGFGVLLVAVLTVTRAVFSLRSVPYLLGRGIYRWLKKR